MNVSESLMFATIYHYHAACCQGESQKEGPELLPQWVGSSLVTPDHGHALHVLPCGALYLDKDVISYQAAAPTSSPTVALGGLSQADI